MDVIKIREIRGKELDRQFDRATRGYLQVKARDLFVGTVLPFSVAFPALNGDGKTIVLKVLLDEGGTFEPRLQEWLTRQKIDDVYIGRDKESVFLQYLSENVKRIVHSPDVPSEQKTMLLYDSAESIVSKVFRERPSRANLELGAELVENLAVHITLDEITSDALFGVFSKDYYTFTHSVQVAILGMAFCNYLRWSKEEVVDFGIGALFHDVGKSHIEDEILNKPSRLTKEEFDVIKKHTLIGYQQLKNTQTLSRDQLIVPLCHHEAMDGTGYPAGMNGKNIHKYARVARIVDCYDALTTKRCYKDALSSAKALEIMAVEMGSTFDGALLQAFVSFLGSEHKAGTAMQGMRLNLELGNEIQIDLDREGIELKLTVIGMATDEVLILRIPGRVDLQAYLPVGKNIEARYTRSDSVYAFTSIVLGYVTSPVPFVMASYPPSVQIVDMRKDSRCECLIRAGARIREDLFQGVILNLSEGGCKLVLKLPAADAAPGMEYGERIEIHPLMEEKERIPLLTGVISNLSITRGKALLGVEFRGITQECSLALRALLKKLSKS